jgi:hypothetical protein
MNRPATVSRSSVLSDVQYSVSLKGWCTFRAARQGKKKEIKQLTFPFRGEESKTGILMLLLSLR